MLTRLVKMTFQPEKVEEFVQLMKKNSIRIKSVDGCEHLQIWQDKNQKNIFFTYSIWQSDEHLQAYRHSELFAEVWAAAKAGFAGKPAAWSVDKIIEHTDNLE